MNKLVSSLNEFAESGFSSFIGRYTVLDVLIGRSVILHGPNVEGIVRGVDLNGALLLETTSGLESFHAGELSVRPL